jgi:hypothetical protein
VPVHPWPRSRLRCTGRSRQSGRRRAAADRSGRVESGKLVEADVLGHASLHSGAVQNNSQRNIGQVKFVIGTGCVLVGTFLQIPGALPRWARQWLAQATDRLAVRKKSEPRGR